VSAESLAAGGAVLRALWYVTLRTHLGRFRRLAARRIQLALSLAAVLGLVALQVYAITTQSETAPGPRVAAAATAGLCIVLAVVSFTAVRGCPIRLRGADVAWLLPCPAGPRALVAWNVAGTGGRAALIGVAAAAGAALRAGELTWMMWQPAVALMGATLLVRGVSYVAHLLTVHGVPRLAVGIAAPLLWSVAALPGALAAAGLAWSPPTWLVGVGTPAWALTGALVQPVIAPAAARWPAVIVAALVAVAVALLAVALGSGYQDRAARQTWETEAIIAAYKDGSGMATAMAEAVAARLPAGVPSFDRLDRLQGEAALLWRAIAGLRRGWRSEMRAPLVLAAAAVATAIVAPAYALVPALPVLLLAALGFLSGFVEELEHLPVRTLPGSAWRKVLAVDAVPVATVTVAGSLVAAPAVVVSAGQVTDLLAVPGVALAAISASSVAALWWPTLGRRVLASAVLVPSTYAVMLAGWSLTAGPARGPALLALGALLATVCWSLCAWLLGHRALAR
jgi:hypothetical protein